MSPREKLLGSVANRRLRHAGQLILAIVICVFSASAAHAGIFDAIARAFGFTAKDTVEHIRPPQPSTELNILESQSKPEEHDSVLHDVVHHGVHHLATEATKEREKDRANECNDPLRLDTNCKMQ